MAELYDLKRDPEERRNLIGDPSQAALIAELQGELARLMQETGVALGTDQMPLVQGFGKELPDPKIR